jgi:peptidoglycan/xylan/chitin deacetylase (PgdA/CDA1 family)
VRGVVRSLVLATSLAAGSWVGLHPSSAASATSSAEAVTPARANETSPLPLASDPAMAQLSPWPHLNPEANIAKAWRLAEGPHREAGDRRRLVTLTFDDGPFPETTPKVLELLDRYAVHATFFVIGRYLDGDGDRARASREVLKNIVAGGHLVGNHTHDHSLLTAISHTQVLEQIDRGASSIERTTGRKPTLFRPPFGELDDFGQEAVQVRGLDVLLWSIEAQDMERDDTQTMFRELVRQLANNEGGVVLLHDIRWTSINILKRLLAYLEAKRYDPKRPEREGYEIVDLPTYLRAVEAAPPQPRTRDPHKKLRPPAARLRRETAPEAESRQIVVPGTSQI